MRGATAARLVSVVLLLLASTLTVQGAAQDSGAAWLVRSLDAASKPSSQSDRSDQSESRAALLDTPMLPGSVIKIVTLVAALESHVIEPDTARMCRRVVTIDGQRYTCTHPDLQRPLTAAEALAHSCNDFFVSLAPRLSRAAVNDVRVRVGLPPLPATAQFAAALIGLDGPRVSPRQLLDVFTRLTGLDRRHPTAMAASTRRVLLDGLAGAARYGSASELSTRGLSALAKTGTAPMPGGGALGLLVAAVPAARPQRALVVVAPGAAGRDAASIAADLLTAGDRQIRVGATAAGGRIRIDTLTLEDYVARTLAGEGQPGAADAASQALAIAVRTFALANRGRHRADGYDMCDTTHCQVLRPATAATRRAAAATAGRVLTRAGRPAAVYYAAWCGGRSARPSDVWAGAVDEDFERLHDDEACAGEPAWTSELSAPEIERALRLAGLKGEALRGLRVTRRTASDRVGGLRAEGFVPAEISGEDFRTAVGRAVGWERLKSTMFDVRRTARGYAFRGRGSGHGVGLCVLGAGYRAAHGASVDDILHFYYPGLRIDQYKPQPPDAVAGGDIQLALPGAEEGQRTLALQVVRRARDEIAARTGAAVPPVIRITVHPNVEGFARATGRSWWVAGATSGAAIDLLPLRLLRTRGQLERTLRHEVAHVLLDGTLHGRPMWVREGAALYFSQHVSPPSSRPSSSAAATGMAPCPTDAELRTASSAETLRQAYVRAEICFGRELAGGTSWRDVR